MIQNDRELHVTKQSIRDLQEQVERLQRVEDKAANHRLSAGGFLAEIRLIRK